MASSTQEVRERNLDRVIALAANGRVHPDKVVDYAKDFDKYVAGNA